MKRLLVILVALCLATPSVAKDQGFERIKKIDWLALWIQSGRCDSSVTSYRVRANDDGESIDVILIYTKAASADDIESLRGCIKAHFEEFVKRFGYSWAKLSFETFKAD